jgi:hypothetical protein
LAEVVGALRPVGAAVVAPALERAAVEAAAVVAPLLEVERPVSRPAVAGPLLARVQGVAEAPLLPVRLASALGVERGAARWREPPVPLVSVQQVAGR